MTYEYGDLVLIRGDPRHKCRSAVRVYSEYTQADGVRYICVMLPSGCGISVEVAFIRKAKRDTAKSKAKWIKENGRKT